MQWGTSMDANSLPSPTFRNPHSIQCLSIATTTQHQCFLYALPGQVQLPSSAAILNQRHSRSGSVGRLRCSLEGNADSSTTQQQQFQLQQLNNQSTGGPCSVVHAVTAGAGYTLALLIRPSTLVARGEGGAALSSVAHAGSFLEAAGGFAVGWWFVLVVQRWCWGGQSAASGRQVQDQDQDSYTQPTCVVQDSYTQREAEQKRRRPSLWIARDTTEGYPSL